MKIQHIKDSHLPSTGHSVEKEHCGKASWRDPISLRGSVSINSKNYCADNFKKTCVNKNVKKTAEISFGGFFSGKTAKKCYEIAAENPLVTTAGAALLATCIFRPIAICLTPGIKKENKQYAATKSISSGIIGFGLTVGVATPWTKAIKKISKNPSKYLKPETIKALKGNKSKDFNFATRFVKMMPEFLVAIPKGALTIALVPVFMSLLFKNSKKMQKEAAKTPVVRAQTSIFFKGKDKNADKIFNSFTEKKGGVQ